LKQALTLLHQHDPQMSRELVLLVVGRVKDDVYKNFPIKTILTGTIYSEETIIKYYNASDIFVLPSLEENLPNTIMEAMSCGTPCVAFKTGGIPDLIDHLENGYLAEFKSAKDLMNGIVRLLSDSEFLTKLQVKARIKVEEHYSYAIIADHYRDVYESVLRLRIEHN